MADTTLADLIQEVKTGNKEQKETSEAVHGLTSVFVKQFKLQERGGGDRLEDKLEANKASRGGVKDAIKATIGVGSLGDLATLAGALRALFSPLGIATIASLTDLDAAIKATRLPKLIKGVQIFFDDTAALFKSIGNIKLPKLPEIKIEGGSFGKLKLPVPRFVTDAGEAIGDFIDFKIRLPVINFVDAAGTKISDFIDYKIRLPVINFVDGVGNKVADFIDYKIKLPALNFIDGLGAKITEFSVKLPELKMPKFLDDVEFEMPRLPKITIGETGRTMLDNFVDAFDKVRAFFSTAYDAMKPLLKPLLNIVKLVVRPFVQVLLSVIDFVVGFVDGFKNEDGTMSEKLLAGLEGGMLGVIKGITEAIDLLFIDIPAWILEKLGFEKLAEGLREFSITEMVDPLWNSIKGVVAFVGDNIGMIKDALVAEVSYQITRITNGFKNAFDRISTFINNLGDNLYIIISENLRFKLEPMSIKNPITGNDLFTIPGFDVGVGDETTRAAAQSRIDLRNNESSDRIVARNNETSAAFSRAQELQNELRTGLQQVIINNIDNSNTDNSSNSSSSVVSTGTNADAFALVN